MQSFSNPSPLIKILSIPAVLGLTQNTSTIYVKHMHDHGEHSQQNTCTFICNAVCIIIHVCTHIVHMLDIPYIHDIVYMYFVAVV